MTGEPDPLENPFWSALTGPHRRFGRSEDEGGRPLAACYDPDISPFVAVADPADPLAWVVLARLVGPDRRVVAAVPDQVPATWEEAGWRAHLDLPGVQMVGTDMPVRDGSGFDPLGPADADDMLALVERTRPGPFERRTVELGGYLGVHVDGRLVAMAGHRCRPVGATEISAVCTDADHRGRGLGARLVQATAGLVTSRGEIPFLHTGAANATAIRLYERLGMTVSRRVRFVGLSRG